jgi:hypothetical protein
MLELVVEHQAGIPILMKPLSGNSREAQDVGKTVRAHVHQLHTTYGMTYLVANSALYTVRAQRRDGKRGHPGPDARPDQVVDQIDRALASSRTSRQALIDQHRCVLLATNELDPYPTATTRGIGRRQRPGPCGARVPILERSAVFSLFTVSEKACAHHGPVDGDDRVFVSVCGLGIPHPPSAQRPCGDVSRPTE